MSSRRHRKSDDSYTQRNRVRLIRGGAEYFSEMAGIMGGAAESIHLQTYILDDDLTGRSIADCLKEAAGRGVRVHVMLDGYASRGLPSGFVDDLISSGVRFRYFGRPFAGGGYLGRRLHHKVVVADGRVAMVGGLNVSDRYNDLPGRPAWLDWAIRVEGPVAAELDALCTALWQRSQQPGQPPAPHPLPSEAPPGEGCAVRVRRNDWVGRQNQVTASYLEMLRIARHEVVIMSSYFLPGLVFRRHMRRAAQRGVRIRLILAGRSDIAISKHAERYMYRWLFRNGIEVHEYRHNVLHGKIAVRDGRWVTCGSYNINNISAYASIELNLDVDDPGFGRQVGEVLSGIIGRDCTAVSEEGYLDRYNPLHRMVQFVSYEVYRLVFFLFTFRFRRGPRLA